MSILEFYNALTSKFRCERFIMKDYEILLDGKILVRIEEKHPHKVYVGKKLYASLSPQIGIREISFYSKTCEDAFVRHPFIFDRSIPKVKHVIPLTSQDYFSKLPEELLTLIFQRETLRPLAIVCKRFSLISEEFFKRLSIRNGRKYFCGGNLYRKIDGKLSLYDSENILCLARTNPLKEVYVLTASGDIKCLNDSHVFEKVIPKFGSCRIVKSFAVIDSYYCLLFADGECSIHFKRACLFKFREVLSISSAYSQIIIASERKITVVKRLVDYFEAIMNFSFDTFEITEYFLRYTKGGKSYKHNPIKIQRKLLEELKESDFVEDYQNYSDSTFEIDGYSFVIR